MKVPDRRIKVVIADDEPAARESIRILLMNQPDFEVIDECANGKEALMALREKKPDLVFLDVQMPDLTGFEVLKQLPQAESPVIVFVTAFDKFAIQAFEISAIDYLLKPYDDERFYQCLDKAKKSLTIKNLQEQLMKVETLLSHLTASPAMDRRAFPKKLSIKNNGRISFVSVEAILFIESEGNFVKIHTTEGIKIANYTFKSLAEVLDPEIFIRIHKSYILNVETVESLEPHFHGDYFIYLKNGNKLKLSRNFKESLQKILNQQS